MHRKRAISSLLIFLFMLSFCAWAQEPPFSQFFASPLYTNPATAGVTYSDGGGRVSLHSRSQWTGNFITSMASWDQEFVKLKGGIGVIIYNDQSKLSPWSTTSVSAIYSFKHTINKKLNLHYGLQTELYQKVLDWSRIRFLDPSDIYNPTNEPRVAEADNVLNMGLGILAKHEHFFAGLAIHNLTKPNFTFGRLNFRLSRKYSFHSGYNFEFKNNKNWQLSPQLLMSKQDKIKQVNAGLLAGYKFIYLGAFYRQVFGKSTRNPGDIIGVIGFKTKRWRLAYSYDDVNADFSDFLDHTHELSLSFAYFNKKVSKEMHKGLMW